MELLNYLNRHFLTQADLLDLAKVSECELLTLQQQNIMPKCSYQLALNYSCDSFFGVFNGQNETQYYAKGYLSWLDIIKSIADSQQIFGIFAQRYSDALKQLNNAWFYVADEKVNGGLDEHIKAEWQHFLAGTYGLCTKSGLPEDIAAKELAILKINELVAQDDPHLDINELTQAVNLLDKSSALFAPHERANSSRHKLIDEVRRKYQLSRY